ncbi:hypothetical protein BDZ94DRAFT_1061481 [Collybia nuda]|uniref:DUF6533 domain-containing protein n=1 Tax=Collybia nuda TaxID=64659 RepID=A0A9P5Y0I6_9AGAR|nr:hypothetical protein BDZ94DRAFT_1061481 [Collybia nuda]
MCLHLQIYTSISILVFDYFETLILEINYIWKSKGIAGKILFSLTRYLPFLYLLLSLFDSYLREAISFKTCSTLRDAVAGCVCAGVIVSEVILLLRTFALWGKNRTLLISLAILLGCICVISVLIISFYLGSREDQKYSFPNSNGCTYISDSKMSLVVIFLLLLNETGKWWHNHNQHCDLSNSPLVIFILTAWIGVQRYRHSITPLVSVLYRDGVLYYALIMGISCGYIFITTMGPENYHDLFFLLQCTMHNVLASRIVLHTRNVAAGRGGSSISINETLEFRVFGDGEASNHILENS